MFSSQNFFFQFWNRVEGFREFPWDQSDTEVIWERGSGSLVTWRKQGQQIKEGWVREVRVDLRDHQCPGITSLQWELRELQTVQLSCERVFSSAKDQMGGVAWGTGGQWRMVDVKMAVFPNVLCWRLYELSCGLDLSPERGNQEKNLKEGFKPECDWIIKLNRLRNHWIGLSLFEKD